MRAGFFCSATRCRRTVERAVICAFCHSASERGRGCCTDHSASAFRSAPNLGGPAIIFRTGHLNRKQRGYRKAIAALTRIEQRYLHLTEMTTRNLHRERDEQGRFIADEADAQTMTDDSEE